MNLIEGTIRHVDSEGIVFATAQGQALPLAGSLPVRIGEKVTLGLRPEHVQTSDEGEGWILTVTLAEQHGASSYIHGTLPDGIPFLVQETGQSLRKTGDTVRIAPIGNKWHLFDATGQRIETC
ncbi:TOBE domain-containing protein [Falsirhodobacter deserti]|uniref:TOBE domain-containing protein n=1 Tax=Falsirhodobacter deserti TaxID=1365611 RepID=UPI003BA8EECD